MRLGSLIPGRFVHRLNRFAALVEVADRRVLVHVANSGRLGELLVPGHSVYLRPRPGAARRCPYDLALVLYGGTLVSVDARLPNGLVAEALRAGRIGPLCRYPRVRAEVRQGKHRLDFVLERGDTQCFIETKSCTLVEDGVALFPDAPTLRGRQHVELLTAARRCGAEACVIFVVQRPDPVVFRPHVEADPDLARALVMASRAGVRVLAYRCRVTRRAISITEPIRVELPEARDHGARGEVLDKKADGGRRLADGALERHE